MQVTVTIPESLNEVSIKQYQHFLRVSENIEGAFLDQRTVEVFCGMRLADALILPRKEILNIKNVINGLFEKDQPFQQRFKIKGIEFGFIPDLENITQGEYADLTTYIGDWDSMHKAMAVMYRPITTDIKGKYLIEDYQGSNTYAEVMKYAPLSVAMGATVFFYHLTNDLLNATQQSLGEELTTEILASLETSTENGDGINHSMHSLKATLEDLMKYLPSQPMSV